MTRNKVAVFYDVPDWAFHIVARNIARVVPGWDFALYGRNDWFGKRAVVSKIVRDADVLVFLWRFDLLAFLDSLDPASWRRMLSPKRPAIVTLVYDHIYQSPDDLAQAGDPFQYSDVVAACSDRLRRRYNASPHLPAIQHVLPDGTDTNMFRPAPRAQGPFTTIGWVGNSKWAHTIATDLKGYKTVYEPAMDILRKANLPVRSCVVDSAKGAVPHADMPQLYQGMDILMCTSAMEGTPNPVLEAMASGTVVISTDVGIVPQVLGPLQSAFILQDRSPAAFARAAKTILSQPGRLAALRAENLDQRSRIDWTNRALLWETMLGEARARKKDCRALARYRSQKPSGLQMARRVVASNPLVYRTYALAQTHCPGAIRQARRAILRFGR